MSKFSTALITWMDKEANVSTRALGADSGVPPPTISMIRAGKREITFDALTLLLTAIRAKYGLDPAKRLLTAYLEDEIPESMADTVEIRDPGRKPASIPSDPLSRALAWLTARAHTDPDFAAWLIQLHNMVEEDTTTPQAAPQPTQAPAAAPGSVTFTIRAEEPLRAAESAPKYRA